MRVLLDGDKKKQTKTKRQTNTTYKEMKRLLADVIRLNKTIDTLYNQINVMASNLEKLKAEYDEKQKKLMLDGSFYVKLSDVKSILGEQFEDYADIFFELALHSRQIKKSDIGADAFVFVRDDGSFVVYFDSDTIPDDIKPQVIRKKVVVW